jgi:hypothetical protein
MTAGKIIVASESLYAVASSLSEFTNQAMSRGERITQDDLKALIWRTLAEATCKYDLSRRELITALEPTFRLLERMYGYVPDIFPPLTNETWRRLRESGGCPPRSELVQVLASVATVAAMLLVAWGLSREPVQ